MNIKNNGKNPNELHDYLIANSCALLLITHNAQYDDGNKIIEATEINIEVAEQDTTLLTNLVEQFMAQ